MLGHRVSILKLYKKLPNAMLHCHQQCVRTPLAPDPRLTWYYQFIFSVIPTGVKWYLIMFFIYISLIINDAASFCVLICHLYNLLNEVSLQAFFPMFLLGCLSYHWVVRDLCIVWIQFLVKCILFKYCLPVYGLFFHLFNSDF